MPSVQLTAVSGIDSPHKRVNGGKSEIRLPLDFFDDSESIQKTVLLSEDDTDTRLLRVMARYFRRREDLGDIPLGFEARGGGGSSTVDHFRTIVNTCNRFCLCVVDSDKLMPGHGMASTAAKAVKIYDDRKPYCDVVVLESREMENLVPSDVIRRLPDRGSKHNAAVEKLLVVEKSELGWIRQFLDLKNGTRLCDLIGSKCPGDVSVAILPLLPMLARVCMPMSKEIENCCDSLECLRGPGCSIVDGFGPKLLIDSVEFLEKSKDIEVSSALCDNTRSDWHRIGGFVFAWCCADNRLAGV